MTPLDHTVRRSARAKRVRVTVHPGGGVEVVLPQRVPERAAAAALRELRPWIERRQAAYAQARAEVERTPGTVPYLGETLRLCVEPGRSRVHRREGELLVPAGNGVNDALERYYRRAARAEVASRLDAACARAETTYTRLTIRSQRSRWASCSSTGAMSFNWRLLLAPPAILDYVVEHEVCHLEVPNHSTRFWALVEVRCPEWREASAWLKRYGTTLWL